MSMFQKEPSLTEGQVIEIVRTNVESQFPKDCSACGYRYSSLKEYLEKTAHIGKPRSYDAELLSWRPQKPLGTFSFAKCECGNTMSICSSSMKVVTMWRLLCWAKKETSLRGVSVPDVLDDLRQKIDNQVLTEGAPS